MRAIPTAIPDVIALSPNVFGDNRGFFYESYNQKVFQDATGLDVTFVQDNHSKSARNVLRGLHYQVRYPQGKLVRVVQGEILERKQKRRKKVQRKKVKGCRMWPNEYVLYRAQNQIQQHKKF